MKRFILNIIFVLSVIGGLKGQCSVDEIDPSILPIPGIGAGFQFTTVVMNPLPYTVTWDAGGGSILAEDPAGAVLVTFPSVGIYTVCATAYYDATGELMCSTCFDYTYTGQLPANPCGDVEVTSAEDPTGDGWFSIEAINLDSVDMTTVSWDVPGGNLVGINPLSTYQIVEYPVEGTYTACFNYTSLSGEACSACTTIDYDTSVTLPCQATIQAGIAVEGTYEYFVYAEFSESIDVNSISWNTGAAAQVPVILPGIPGLIQVDFGGPGIYPVCVTANTVLGTSVCDACLDVVVEAVVPDTCVASFLAVQQSQPGMIYSFEINSNTNLMDLSTVQWDLGGGTLVDPDATLNDISVIGEFPSEGIYTVCLNASDLNGDDCSLCQDILVFNYTPQPCSVEVFSDQWNPTGYEYFVMAEIQGDADLNTLTWDFGGGTGGPDPFGFGSNFQLVTFPGAGTYTVCASATGDDGNICTGCHDIVVEEYVPTPCDVQISENISNPLSYIYDFHASVSGDVDNGVPFVWTYAGGTLLIDNGNSIQVQFPSQGTYDICVDVTGLDGNVCSICNTVLVEEYVPQPCVVLLDYYISSPENYIISAFANFEGDVDWSTISWDTGGGTLSSVIDPIGLNFVDIAFAGPGTYTICATATGIDGVDCSTCVDVTLDPYVAPPCEAGFWYYLDPYTGIYYAEGYSNYGVAPFTYEWTVPELGIVLSNDQSFTLDSNAIPVGLPMISLCLNLTDANGDECNYCEPVGSGNIFPPFFPGSGCLDWGVIDMNMVCPTVIDPVCGCDGVTYENACVAESYFGVTQYVQGECPGYVDPTVPVDPAGCTGEFFYLGQPNADGGVDLIFFGFGNNADDYVWDFGNGTTSNGPDAYLSLDSLEVMSSYTVCMTTVSFWDTCSVTVCETIVLDPDPTGWIGGFIFDNSDGIGAPDGQVERVANSNGDPMPGVTVEIVDWNGNVLESTVTDVNGEYIFTSLYFGDFHLHVNIEGVNHTPYLVTLGPTKQFAEDVNFELTEGGDVVSGIEEFDFASSISLSPNPTTDDVVLTMDILQNTNLSISILDITGRLLTTSEENVVQGVFTKSMDLRNYTAGVYFISIQSGNDIITQKVIKR